MKYLEYLQHLEKQGLVNSKQALLLEQLYMSYAQAACANNQDETHFEPVMTKYLEFVIQESIDPFSFEPFHKALRAPFDFYRFGLEIMRPLVMFERSKIFHEDKISEIEEHLAKKENVILLANHQIEPDPQVISLMLEDKHPKLAENMIFVAGHRVITDPMAIPFSKGCNLLCIFSKRHIENPPEQKNDKLLHNRRTMQKMTDLLAEGGQCIYVAPSGGRDRPNPETGKVEIAAFDPQSIEMFWLMAQQSKKTTHFYPLTLATYDLLPPPHTVDKELGERRIAGTAPVFLSFGAEVSMDHFDGSENLDKKSKRYARAHYIWSLVKTAYEDF